MAYLVILYHLLGFCVFFCAIRSASKRPSNDRNSIRVDVGEPRVKKSMMYDCARDQRSPVQDGGASTRTAGPKRETLFQLIQSLCQGCIQGRNAEIALDILERKLEGRAVSWDGFYFLESVLKTMNKLAREDEAKLRDRVYAPEASSIAEMAETASTDRHPALWSHMFEGRLEDDALREVLLEELADSLVVALQSNASNGLPRYRSWWSWSSASSDEHGDPSSPSSPQSTTKPHVLSIPGTSIPHGGHLAEEQRITVSVTEASEALRALESACSLFGEKANHTAMGRHIVNQAQEILRSDPLVSRQIRAIDRSVVKAEPYYYEAYLGVFYGEKFDHLTTALWKDPASFRKDMLEKSRCHLKMLKVETPNLFRKLIKAVAHDLRETASDQAVGAQEPIVSHYEANYFISALMTIMSTRIPVSAIDEVFATSQRVLDELRKPEHSSTIIHIRSLPFTLWFPEWQKFLESDPFKRIFESLN